ncbi:MAG TPA: alpha/beta fold hydrolase [Pseudonocardiaceae bacterium]|nr:alpha/beta fold hydrolase [Pseudonocardiaceae bacterium]
MTEPWLWAARTLDADLDVATAAVANLVRRYGERHRWFHNLDQVAEVVEQADLLARETGLADRDRAIVVLAACARHVIYRAHPGPDHVACVLWVAEWLERAEIMQERVSRVEQLVLHTVRHSSNSTDTVSGVLLDANLSVLAAEPEVYDRYTQRLRAEYHWLDAPRWVEGRAHVLANFLSRRPLYRTEPARRRWEAAARANMSRELAHLLDLVVVDAGGVNLACRTFGPVDAPPVVLLHTLHRVPDTPGGVDWVEVAAALAADYRVYVPEMRGHGQSDWEISSSYQTMVGDLAGLLDALGIGSATVVGHGDGGVLAYLFAAAHPGRVARLVLEEAPPPARAKPWSGSATPPTGIRPQTWQKCLALWRRDHPDIEWFERAEAIPVPTLVIAGGGDSHLPQEQLAAMAEQLPAGRLVTIPVGHQVHRSRPAEWLATVAEFLRDTPDVRQPA